MKPGPAMRMLPLLALAGAIPFVAPAFAAVPFDPAYNPHSSFRDRPSCPRCHPVVGGNPAATRLKPGSVAFCAGCHVNGSLGRSHPVGGRPREGRPDVKVTGDFPLDDDGRMTCLACHRAHGPFVATTRAYPGQEPENPGSAAGATPYYRTVFLRRTDPVKGFSVLCDGCHGTR